MLEDPDVEPEDIFGLFFSSDYCGAAEASELTRVLNEKYDGFGLQTDGTSMSEIRMIQDATSHHTARAKDGQYTIAVSSGQKYSEDSPNGAASIAYLIGDDPFLHLSAQGGLEGTYSEENKSTFQQELQSMKDGLDGFIQNASEFNFSFGSSVVGNNSNLVSPDSINYALFSIPEVEQKQEASARGFGRLARAARDYGLDFDLDPGTRDPEQYLQNLYDSEEFQEFYRNSVEPTLVLEKETGIVEPGMIGLQRAATLLDEDLNKDGIMMVGSLGRGGRNAEVHAERIIDDPKIQLNSKNPQKISAEELSQLASSELEKPLSDSKPEFAIEDGKRTWQN